MLGLPSCHLQLHKKGAVDLATMWMNIRTTRFDVELHEVECMERGKSRDCSAPRAACANESKVTQWSTQSRGEGAVKSWMDDSDGYRRSWQKVLICIQLLARKLSTK